MALVALILSAYSFALQDHFKTMDDVGSIIQNEWIKDATYLGDIFKSSYFGRNSYYRPLVSVSYMLEYHFFGLDAFYYYLDNIFIHIASCVILFFVIRRLFRRQMLAFGVALLFAIHPVQWEAITNISGRAILLCGFFIIKSFHFFVISEKKPRSYFTAIIFFCTALLSKESAAMFPLILLSYQFFVREELSLKKKILPLIPFFAMDLIYVIIRRLLGITHFFYWNSPQESLLGFLTFLRSLITHLRLLVFPVDLQFDRSRDLFMSFLNGEVLLTLTVFILAMAAIFKLRKRIPPLALFFLSWFLIEFIPVCQLIFSIGVQPGRISTAEHFLYVASIGIFVLMALLWEKIERVNENKKFVSPKLLKWVVAAFYLFLFITTIQQNIYASNEIAMFERSLQLSPQNARIRNSLAFSYAKLGDFAEAEKHFRATLSVVPNDGWAIIGLGKSLVDQGKFWEGIQVYERINNAGGLGHVHEGNLKAAYRLLLQEYEAMLQQGRDDYLIYYSLGIIYSKLDRIQEAAAAYQKSIERKPDFKNSVFNLASLLEATGDLKKAVIYYEKVLALDKETDDRDVYVCRRLAAIYAGLGNQRKAEAYSREAGAE